jgi:hypothetical protein
MDVFIIAKIQYSWLYKKQHKGKTIEKKNTWVQCTKKVKKDNEYE